MTITKEHVDALTVQLAADKKEILDAVGRIEAEIARLKAGGKDFGPLESIVSELKGTTDAVSAEVTTAAPRKAAAHKPAPKSSAPAKSPASKSKSGKH